MSLFHFDLDASWALPGLTYVDTPGFHFFQKNNLNPPERIAHTSLMYIFLFSLSLSLYPSVSLYLSLCLSVSLSLPPSPSNKFHAYDLVTCRFSDSFPGFTWFCMMFMLHQPPLVMKPQLVHSCWSPLPAGRHLTVGPPSASSEEHPNWGCLTIQGKIMEKP